VDFLAETKKYSPDTRFLLIADREEVDAVLPLFGRGLNDALLQPINPKRAMASLLKLLKTNKPISSEGEPGLSAAPFATDFDHRPIHLAARSPAMRKAVAALWNARKDPLGVILRGEAGVEFELAAREFQAMGGDLSGNLVVLDARELDVEMLATQLSLDRLNEGVPRTYFVADVEKLTSEQGKPLLEFLRRARRQREREKPLRIVFAAHSTEESVSGADGEFLEELQFIMPAVVKLPPLADRREDIPEIARRVLMDLTAIFPAYRARSFHPAAIQWLASRAWQGNHQELVAALRRAVVDCAHREITAMHFGKLVEVGEDPEEAAASRMIAAIQRAQVR
jgi:two-component system NtrC family response regulator